MLTVMKKILLPAIAFLTLAACEDPWNREGVGFTGIDGEPRTTADVPGTVAFQPPLTNVPAELAALPPVRVASDDTSLEKMAGVAIENGGRTTNNAVVVEGADRNLMLSTVKVNNTLFAVLREPSNSSARMDNSVGASFVSRIERLTGCLAAGGTAYGKGSRRSSTGFAVPLNCS